MKKTRDERWAWWFALVLFGLPLAYVPLHRWVLEDAAVVTARIGKPDEGPMDLVAIACGVVGCLVIVGWFRRAVMGRGKARPDPKTD